jgi:hypothetical protein
VGSVPSFLAVDNLYIHGVCASFWIARSCHWWRSTGCASDSCVMHDATRRRAGSAILRC